MEACKVFDPDHGQEACEFLKQQGYVIFDRVFRGKELQQITSDCDRLMAEERQVPFDPGDGPESPDDAEIEAYLARTYKVNAAELSRVMKRVRHTRARNHATPWPVPAEKVNHNFLHIPLLLDEGRLQRCFNLPAKLSGCDRLFDHPILRYLMGELLGEDCVLSDMAATRIGPQSEPSYWHVDSPFTMVPEPLPAIPMAIAIGWMLDDFTVENGATRVVPGTHLSGRKPSWTYDSVEGELALTAAAGSLAVWFSQTWHRAGTNLTDGPRRAVLGNFICAWIKPFTDFTRSIPAEVVDRYSPRARYLLGWSAFGPARG